MKKKITLKQILAAAVLLLLIGMYVTSFVLACLAKPGAADLFLASVAATILIPIVLYFFLLMTKTIKKKEENQMPLSDLRKYNRRLQKGESPEKIADEIEEKYK